MHPSEFDIKALLMLIDVLLAVRSSCLTPVLLLYFLVTDIRNHASEGSRKDPLLFSLTPIICLRMQLK